MLFHEMKKESGHEDTPKHIDNSFGVAAVVLGTVGITSSAIGSLILGIVALVFATKQQKKTPNSWGKAGKILSIISLAIGIITIILIIHNYIKNPLAYNQLLNQYPQWNIAPQ